MAHFASPSHATANIAYGTNLLYPIRVQSFEVLVIDAQYLVVPVPGEAGQFMGAHTIFIHDMTYH